MTKRRLLYDTIDLPRLSFSLLIVTPRQEFIMWLTNYFAQRGITDAQIHVPQDDSVWIIPRLERFASNEEFREFVDDAKPKMLLAELYGWGATLADFGQPVSAVTFDRFFECALRREAALITEILN